MRPRTDKMIAKYPGDKDGMASFCISLRMTLPQEMLLQFQALAVIGLRPEWSQWAEEVAADGPVYILESRDLGEVRRVEIAHVAAGLQMMFDRKRIGINHNLRMRFLAAFYTDWGIRYIDAAAAAALVTLGWGKV